MREYRQKRVGQRRPRKSKRATETHAFAIHYREPLVVRARRRTESAMKYLCAHSLKNGSAFIGGTVAVWARSSNQCRSTSDVCVSASTSAHSSRARARCDVRSCTRKQDVLAWIFSCGIESILAATAACARNSYALS